MGSSVGEDIPPDRGRNSLDLDKDDFPNSNQPNNKLASKHSLDLSCDIQPKRRTPFPATASVQHTYVRPGYDVNSELRYTESDSGPFLTHITRLDDEPSIFSNGMKSLKIAQLIHTNKITGIEEIRNIGRKKLSVLFKNYTDANNFLSAPFLHPNKLQAIIPRYHVTRMGVVHNIPLDWTLEELIDYAESHVETPIIIKARRLNKKRTIDGKPVWEPTGTVVLTFLGQILPQFIYCCNMSVPVQIYTLPTIQCHKCCRFGHIRDKCRSNPRCSRCAGPHDSIFCTVSDNSISCLFCSGSHLATDPKCPEYSRQKSIKLVMSEENISYSEAARRFRPARRLFSDIVSASQPSKPVYFSRSSQNNITSSSSKSDSPQIPSVSYKKTVLVERRPKPELGKSYDRQAHFNITSSPASSLPNGCALENNSSTNSSSDDNLAQIISLLFTNILSKCGDKLPNNVLNLIKTVISSILTSILNNGEVSTMELS